MNGRKLYVMPAITAIGVASTWKFCGSRPIRFSGPRIRPSSASRNCHCDRPDDERHEERQQEQEQEDRLAPPAVERDPVRDRIGEQERERGDDARVHEGPHVDVAVLLERVRVVREVPVEVEAADEARLQRRVEHETIGIRKKIAR